MLEVCSGVINKKEKGGVYERPVGFDRKGRERLELRYELKVFKRVLEVRT